MPRKIVLHIGAAKTGSSAIQAFLRSNIDFFTQNNFVIPDRLMGLSQKITGEHVFALQDLMSPGSAERLRTVFQKLRDQPDPEKIVLVSAENLSNLGQHAKIAEALDGFEAEVIIYIRRQDDLLSSAWQQWHSKVESDFNAWLIKALRIYGQWDRLIENWQGVVGEKNVRVRIFDRKDMIEGDLLRDFISCLGLDPKTDEPIFDVGDVNPSYSDLITPLVQGNTDIFDGPNDSEFYRLVGDLTKRTYVDRKKISLMSPDQRESVIFYYDAINRRVCDKYFPGRAHLFAPINHDKYKYLSGDEMVDEQLRFLAHMIYKIGKKQP